MRYTIFSVDDSRKHYTDKIRRTLSNWNEVKTTCVDGRVDWQLGWGLSAHPYDINFDARVGHLGIWYTVLNAIDKAPLVTFEDDALLGQNFDIHLNLRLRQLPEDTDFFSLFLPRDSDHLYTESHSVSKYLCRTYQRYGGVSMYYTEQGADKVKWLLNRDGITGQYDDTLYAYSKSGELNGYCSKPQYSDLVYITGEEDSIVQETDYL